MSVNLTQEHDTDALKEKYVLQYTNQSIKSTGVARILHTRNCTCQQDIVTKMINKTVNEQLNVGLKGEMISIFERITL